MYECKKQENSQQSQANGNDIVGNKPFPFNQLKTEKINTILIVNRIIRNKIGNYILFV